MEKKNSVIVILLTLCCLALYWIPTGHEGSRQTNTTIARGKVLSVKDEVIHTAMIIKTGTQLLQMEIMEGQWKGLQMEATNLLTGKLEVDEYYVVADEALVEFSVNPQGEILAGYVRGHYRLHYELVLAIVFSVLLLVTAGWTGVKALLSFVFSVLMIWKCMVPLFLRGGISIGGRLWVIDPVILGLIVVAILTAAISFLVGGVSRKGLTTLLGSFLGLLLTGMLAIYYTKCFKIHGAVQPFSEMLLYSGHPHVDLTRIFIASVFIASSGAVMDLSMDVAAAMDEIKMKNPDMCMKEHMESGLRVGRAVIGTMTTTLFLAYSGGYIFLLMYLMSMQIPGPIFLNKTIIAAEILNTLVGSLGLVTVAPITAITGGIIYHVAEKQSDKEEAVMHHAA
ncbi:MAG: YibE/F family protein [Sedimentisphaerales bacterium]|nr:YibE/F family protein [Sedimentisphaerales bacterium]